MNIRLASNLHPVFLAHRGPKARLIYPTVGRAATQKQLTVSGRQVRKRGRKALLLVDDRMSTIA